MSALSFSTFLSGFHDLSNNFHSVFLIMCSSFLLSFLLLLFLPHLNSRNSRIHNLCIQFYSLVLTNNTVLDYVLETSGMCSGSFPLISSPDEIFYFLIRKSKTMLIDSVDFGMIWKEQKTPKWPERCACLCSKFDRLPSPGSKLLTLCFEQTF